MMAEEQIACGILRINCRRIALGELKRRGEGMGNASFRIASSVRVVQDFLGFGLAQEPLADQRVN